MDGNSKDKIVQKLDDGEFIEVLLVPKESFLETIIGIINEFYLMLTVTIEQSKSCVVDSKLYTFAIGLKQSKN